MSVGYAPRVTQDVQIEQAIAFGHSLDWMLEKLGASPMDVDRVLKRLDAINRSPDCEPAVKPYRKTGARA